MRTTATRWLLAVIVLAAGSAIAGPEEDRVAFVEYFQSRFPDVPFAEFANGIYAIDDDARRQWIEIEEFPPYEFSLESGESLWAAPLPDGAAYADCFPMPLPAIRGRYPYFDADAGEVITLPVAINDCRAAHDDEPLSYDSSDMIDLTSFLAYAARGTTVETVVPDDSRALAAYEDGKRFYYTKRGQLNFACSDCHVTSVGQYVRADRLGPSLGHPTHFPVYRSKLGRVISLHERFHGCVRDVGAKPFELESREYRNLEYFLSYMSNGLAFNGPGARK